MRTQSVDTNPEVERIMIEMIRQAGIRKRFRLVQSLTQSSVWAGIQSWQESHCKVGEVGEREAAVHFVSHSYGMAFARHVQMALEMSQSWHVQPINLLEIMGPVLSAFNELGVPYYLGGSIASSLYGMQQLAQDIDLIADLQEHTLSPLLTLLQRHYILNKDEVQQAMREHMSFPLLHLDSLMKIDVVLPKTNAFHTSMRQLVVQHALDECYSPVRVASACEMILFKLQRYQRDEQSGRDGMQDDAEWNDILGMLKVQGHELDLAFLEKWTSRLDVMTIWHRALVDAGLSEI